MYVAVELKSSMCQSRQTEEKMKIKKKKKKTQQKPQLLPYNIVYLNPLFSLQQFSRVKTYFNIFITDLNEGTEFSKLLDSV